MDLWLSESRNPQAGSQAHSAIQCLSSTKLGWEIMEEQGFLETLQRGLEELSIDAHHWADARSNFEMQRRAQRCLHLLGELGGCDLGMGHLKQRFPSTFDRVKAAALQADHLGIRRTALRTLSVWGETEKGRQCVLDHQWGASTSNIVLPFRISLLFDGLGAQAVDSHPSLSMSKEPHSMTVFYDMLCELACSVKQQSTKTQIMKLAQDFPADLDLRSAVSKVLSIARLSPGNRAWLHKFVQQQEGMSAEKGRQGQSSRP